LGKKIYRRLWPILTPGRDKDLQVHVITAFGVRELVYRQEFPEDEYKERDDVVKFESYDIR
jgi:hypothetical protein